MNNLYALGLGIGTKNKNNDWLDVFFAAPLLEPSTSDVEHALQAVGYTGGNTSIEVSPQHLSAIAEGNSLLADTAKSMIETNQPVVLTILENDDSPASVPEAYLKLHLLSHRLVQPHQTKLDGIFGALPNVAWTNQGPVDIAELPEKQLQARVKGQTLTVECVDKFPKMTNYVVPTGVRIAHTARVRLGAYIGEGTTIMHEGFVNFNAGTLGTSMIEGRISAGVVIGAGSDLGGGSSTMGTLSGGGNIIISVGEKCLIGANAGIGIPLGDRCTVESGLYITAGTKVNLLDDKNAVVGQVKARELAGKDDLLFRRNSLNGAVECLTNRSAVVLNEQLHVNN